MSKEVAFQRLKEKYPTLKLIKQELFHSIHLPQKDPSSQFIPFISQRDNLGRIISKQNPSLLKVNEPEVKTYRPKKAIVRRKDEVGLDNLLTFNFKNSHEDIVIGGKLTKHAFENQYDNTRPKNKISIEPRLKLIKNVSLPQVFPFYELSKHDDYFFKRTPITKIIPPKKNAKELMPVQQKIPVTKHDLIKPSKKPIKEVIKMPKMSSSQGKRGLKITQNLAEEFKRFQTELDKARNLAIRVKNQTSSLKSYVR